MDRGLFKIIVSVWSMLVLALLFIIFTFLFSSASQPQKQIVESSFKSIDGPYNLEVFLSSPSGTSTESLGLDYSFEAANSDLIGLVCTDKNNQAYRVVVGSAEKFFERIYGESWALEIKYYELVNDKLIERRTDWFGHGRNFERVGTSMIPCKEEGMIAKITLLSLPEKTKYQDFRFK